MYAHLQIEAPDADLLREAMDVYAGAFGEPPYYEGPEQVDGFAEKVHRYASERDGFRFAAVRSDTGRLDAIGLAVLAVPRTDGRPVLPSASRTAAAAVHRPRVAPDRTTATARQ